MSKKKCEFYKACDTHGKNGYDGIKCKGCNSKCEIVTKKPKYKTIKGWAGMTMQGAWRFIEQGHGVLAIPAELRIKTKDLGDK